MKKTLYELNLLSDRIKRRIIKVGGMAVGIVINIIRILFENGNNE